jgi:hypothetical protein
MPLMAAATNSRDDEIGGGRVPRSATSRVIPARWRGQPTTSATEPPN